MDYVALLQPLFAYAAHVAAAAEQPGWLQGHAPAVKRDLSLLLGSAMRSRQEPLDPNFDQAWFAFTRWLRFTLEQLPDDGEIAREFVPGAEGGDGEFHRRLSLLLTPLPGGYPGDILEIIRVYALCLDLGYRETPSGPGARPNADSLRQRCRELLESSPALPARRPAPRASPRFAAALAVRLLPPLLPIVLYGLYRYLLSALYANVVG